MRRYIRNSSSAKVTLEDEANRIYDVLEKYPETGSLKEDSDGDYVISFADDTSDLSYIMKEIKNLGYSLYKDEGESYIFRGPRFDVWVCEDIEEGIVEVYIVQ